MYYLKKTIEISAAHRLLLDYESKCASLHGHNWLITVHCKGHDLNKNGMLVDFAYIKKVVMQLDHGVMNDTIMQPTAENIARAICDSIPTCYRVDVQETEGNVASYEADELK